MSFNTTCTETCPFKFQHKGTAKHLFPLSKPQLLHANGAQGRNKELTFPWATSSRCAADADLTSAAVAAAMDLAASRICSSKFRLSSAFCQGKRRQVLDDLAQQLTSLCQCHWQQAVCQTTDAFFLFFLNLKKKIYIYIYYFISEQGVVSLVLTVHQVVVFFAYTLSSLSTLMQESFWWWQCNDRCLFFYYNHTVCVCVYSPVRLRM